MYADIIEKLHASNMKVFEVYAIYLSIQYEGFYEFIKNCIKRNSIIDKAEIIN